MKTIESGIVNVDFGNDVTVVKPVNLYGCSIGACSFIGPFVEIQRNARIGNRTRIQSHSFICELVSIGDDCFVSHGVMFTNDLFLDGKPASNAPEKLKTTVVGDRVVIGSNSTILPVSICDDVVIGAGSVVTRNIEQPGIYFGSPARFHRTL